MSGTKSGGIAARDTNIRKYGEGFYHRLGKLGGAKGNTGGFYWMKINGLDEKIKQAGRKGGTISRRRKSATKKSSV